MNLKYLVLDEGSPLPLGTTVTEHGVNFSLFSRHAVSVILVIFEHAGPESPFVELLLDPKKNRTGDIWHCFVKEIGEGALYLYRADGPYLPEKGLRYNVHKALIDPYARALTDLSHWDINAAKAYIPEGPYSDLSFSCKDDIKLNPRCVVIDNTFDWQGDKPLNYPLRNSILYEAHVKGMTRNENAKTEYPGTYRSMIEMIPYLKDLGITSLELLPIHEFNENENDKINPRTGERLYNYWGYSTIAFFAPKGSYSFDKTPGGQVNEFKEMVREFHKAGIEIILDIVFNHTAEGNERGPTFSFRGLDNTIYYMLDANKRYYKNYSGCGNTVNCNHPAIRTFILDCLHYWVVEMHVDGFRFDLGSILGRDQQGHLMENPPVLEQIAEDPILRNTKIIAEAWDAGGAYQVGWFPGGRWAEWNDRYRDDIRKFWRGDKHEVRHLATRISGSSDLYLRDGRKPFHSINFITSHDGFTLRDLVSYGHKHNEENGEENRDGGNENYSSNYGFEGPSMNQVIESVRERQMKNFFATLMISLGTPMILGGDEIGRTQKGNNNAYCQDNEISWYDWSLLKTNDKLYRFVKEMIAFRRRHPAFMRPEFFTGKDGSYNAIPDISWFDHEGNDPKWDEMDALLGLRLDGSKADILADRDDNDFFIMFNASNKMVSFKVPPSSPDEKNWYRAVDTGLDSPNDIMPNGHEIILDPQDKYLVKAKSTVVLISK